MASEEPTAFNERLTVPWWSWPVALAVAAGLAFEIGLGVPGLVTWLPFVVLVPGAAVAMAWLGRIRVAVRDRELLVDDAVLPMEYVESAEPLTGTALRDALSAQLHPLAFVIQRPWIKSAVKVTLNDPDDPTPYWIVSSRDPRRLAEALGGVGAAPHPAVPPR
ncbi:DUF3093 domain-containing protein [Stackebrandtia albiflava]|nr:DUF3093 domain-containing protein [Stackebrandtia albiflava]